jgi:peroxiredoxin Q/BCP
VAKSYGASAPLIGTRRAVFIIDEQGVVRFKHLHRLGLDYLDATQLRDAVAQASGATA